MRSLLLVATALAKKGWSESLRFARSPHGATTIGHVVLAFATGSLSDFHQCEQNSDVES